MKKLVIAGSRDLHLDGEFLATLISQFYDWFNIVTDEGIEIVSGGCPTGVDKAAKELAKLISAKYTEFSANWDKFGKGAGPIRNGQMANYGDMLLVIHNNSKGSLNMKMHMDELKKPVYEVIVNKRKYY